MPTRQQVFTVADQIRARRERVSLRSVRALLPYGGSYGAIGEHLSAWKAEWDYQPRIEMAQLPEFLQTSLANAGKTLWEATRQFNAERERAEGIVKAERQLRDEALALTDALEARMAALQAELRTIRLEVQLDRQSPDAVGTRAL